VYYRLVVPPAEDVTVAAAFSAATEAEFYVRYADLPDRVNFAQTASDVTALNPTLSVANAQGGDYYILLHGREGAGAGQPFTLHADAAVFGVTGFSPDSGSRRFDATVTVAGTKFTRQTAVTLTDLTG